MNEHIKEAWDRAINNDDTWDGQVRFLETFAHNIIRECMAICDTEKVEYIKHRKNAWDFEEKNIYAEGAAASDSIKHKIKRSFGIK